MLKALELGTGQLTSPVDPTRQVAVHQPSDPDLTRLGYKTSRAGLTHLTRRVQVTGSWTWNQPDFHVNPVGLVDQAEGPGWPTC